MHGLQLSLTIYGINLWIQEWMSSRKAWCNTSSYTRTSAAQTYAGSPLAFTAQQTEVQARQTARTWQPTAKGFGCRSKPNAALFVLRKTKYFSVSKEGEEVSWRNRYVNNVGIRLRKSSSELTEQQCVLKKVPVWHLRVSSASQLGFHSSLTHPRSAGCVTGLSAEPAHTHESSHSRWKVN